MSKQKNISKLKPLNPFSITIEGLTLLFSRAQSVAIMLVIVSVVAAVFGYVTPSPVPNEGKTAADGNAFFANLVSTLTPGTIIIGVSVLFIICLFILVASTMLHGIQSYTIAQLAHGKTVTLKEAFNAVLEQFGRYFILIVWMNVRIGLWALLFIVPGIIAYYRYSFAGPLFFDKKLRGDAALRESSRLTERGLLTIYASQLLFNIITFFYGNNLIVPSSLSVLYREYTALDTSSTPKPKPHAMSWVALLLPFLMFTVLILLVILLSLLSGSQIHR
jgi:hypothetical protein